MKNNFLCFMFILIVFMVTRTSSNPSRGDTRHHRRYSAKTIREKIGYMKPIRLGPTSQLNVTSLLSLLQGSNVKSHRLTELDSGVENEKLQPSEPTSHLNVTSLLSLLTGTNAKSHKDIEREEKEYLLKLQFPEEAPKEETHVFEKQKTEDTREKKTEDTIEEKTEDIKEEKKDPVGISEVSSEEEEPMMRAGEGLNHGREEDLQYDIDEDDLRMPI